MQCLRCGYCCHHLSAIIVDDPQLGPCDGNLILHAGGGERCQHLQGDTPGKYSCRVHNYEWYEETPCFDFGQVESSDSPCRLGKCQMEKLKCRVEKR